MKYVKLFLLVAVALFAVSTAVAYAEPAEPSIHRDRINLEFYASKYFTINKKIDRVFVGTKDIVRVAQPANSPNEFVITAQNKKGSTTLFVWTADGARYEYLINVVDEEMGQAEIIEQAINLPNVHVKKVGDRILLTGKVKNQYERNYALQTAALYVDEDGGDFNLSVGSNVDMQVQAKAAASGSVNITVDTNKVESNGKIIDLLEMETPIQIRLETQVIEISTDKAKDLGIEYGMSGTGGIFYFGEDYTRKKTYTHYTPYIDSSTGRIKMDSYSYEAHNTPLRENPLRWLEENFSPINATIHALVNNGDARILSRPTITTMLGEEAMIHIGGKIPYSTVDDSGRTRTEFENYGIILQFKSVMDSQNRITSSFHTEVSNMTGETVDGQPILAVRSADSLININSGSTMVIGGLMDSSESKRVQKIPLLGNIPILGEFFKYTATSRDKRELIIVVTPYLVGAEDTNHVRMSNELKDLYNAGQREYNYNTTDVDLNELPPPFDPNEEKAKKDKKYKKSKKSDEVVISDYPSGNTTNTNNNESTNNTNNENVEVFGDNY